MKSILIVTEQFTIGGLETHIRGEIERLSESGVEVHLATGNAFNDALLPANLSAVEYGLPLETTVTPEEFLLAVNRLRKIIRQNSIDFLHIHPFGSIIPSVVAAELEAVPFAITLHGPADLERYYGKFFDFLIKDAVLPNSGLVIVVSPEVGSLYSMHVAKQSLVYIPNCVSFEDLEGSAAHAEGLDPRWLVVSRLEHLKVNGIIDFCIKAKGEGIPGVLIVGDGPAKQHLIQMLEEHGLSDYANLVGASTEVHSLMQKCAGVAGMGRVVLEGVASRKPVVLVGYDGVKGVVDEVLLVQAQEANFSGRGLPTVGQDEFSAQLREKTGGADISAVFEAAKAAFNDRDAWALFLDRMSSLAPPAPTALTGLYHSLSGSPLAGIAPYLYSEELCDRMGTVASSKNYYDARLAAAVSFCRQRLESASLNQAVAERDGQIASLNQAVAERDGQIASLNQAVAERDGQIASLNQAVAERDGQIATLNQAVAERDGQIASLNPAVAERDGQISTLNHTVDALDSEVTEVKRKLTVTIEQYNKVMNSNSMRLTAPVRIARRMLERCVHLPLAFFAVVRTHGLSHAVSKVKVYLKRKYSHSVVVSDLTMSNQEKYLTNKGFQNEYLANFLATDLDASYIQLIHEGFTLGERKEMGIVLYPLSYPMELTQRPDHILRSFAERGYLCIMISIDNNPPFIKEISNNLFQTNLYAPVISYFSKREIIFYITYPYYSYILNHLQKSKIIYDVLDDLSVFSLPCEGMEVDHRRLLERAEITLFSSQELFNANINDVKGNAVLVSNGVWRKDFEIPREKEYLRMNFKKHSDEFVVGYHGAITELLDWGLLETLIKIPRVRLVLIGPLAHFDSIEANALSGPFKRVLAAKQVTHVETVPYADLKYYLSGFDAAIIPFLINEKTHPVSPLKLFEYMAIGLEIFATPTRTLSRYSQYICVADRASLPLRIQELVNNNARFSREIDYTNVLMAVDWGRQLDQIFAILGGQNPDIMVRRRKTKHVDIVNVNFFDWDGVNLYKGGAERYVYDLACMLKEDGWFPRILQNANKPFELVFRGIPVVGVPTNSGNDLRGMSKRFCAECKDAELVIASPADLACEMRGLNVVGINHGIYWDSKFKSLENFNLNEYKNIFDAIKVSSSIVAVDTNFINWVRTYDYNLAHKITYIPNYVDHTVFLSKVKDFSGKVRILYPRRLYEARGIFLTLKAFDYLFQQHDDIELHLVGQANQEDTKVVSEFVQKYEGRVFWEELDMAVMPSVYQMSHIALIPTMYSEGTSLSCLEAMATNNVIIATNVGGLPNLVVDRFNGLLINPTVDRLIRSVESLLANRELMRSMAARGKELAAAFGKTRWLTCWRNIVTEISK